MEFGEVYGLSCIFLCSKLQSRQNKKCAAKKVSRYIKLSLFRFWIFVLTILQHNFYQQVIGYAREFFDARRWLECALFFQQDWYVRYFYSWSRDGEFTVG